MSIKRTRSHESSGSLLHIKDLAERFLSEKTAILCGNFSVLKRGFLQLFGIVTGTRAFTRAPTNIRKIEEH